MPAVTFDGRSLLLDGKRIWLVSGSIPYARVPRELWKERILAARAAGLNTIETPVFWNRHEPRAGQFDFKGGNDIRHFLELIRDAGLHCILRPGPFVGQGWDFGGLPPWLMGVKGVRLRVANGPFLEACSRYITAVAGQVRDMQVGSGGRGGPVVLVQSESSWTCGDDALANAYLGELNRYYREAGITVPLLNANNLWVGVESEIDGWIGSGDLLPTVRQLAAVRPHQPRIVMEFGIAPAPVWGAESPAPPTPDALEQRLAQILAAGGQFNLHPFHGGTNFGFWGGRIPDEAGAFAAASADAGAPLAESGLPGPLHQPVRRICTFASRFARLFAHLDPEYRPVVPTPVTDDEAGGRGGRKDGGGDAAVPTVVHCNGSQGGVAFIFRGQRRQVGKVRLLLPHGGEMTVDAGDAPVTWCLFDTTLSGRGKLDYCGLSAFATVGKVLVVFGGAGVEGPISINGSPLRVTVPKGKTPLITEHEGITLVVCTPEQLETVHVNDDAVFVGVSGLNAAGEPLALGGERKCTRIGADGRSSQVPAAAVHVKARSEKLALSEWEFASAAEYCSGTSARFAVIERPAELMALGAPYGYGWYRLRVKSPGGKLHVAIPQGGDRLHLFADGEPAGLLGVGPGAAGEAAVSFKKGQNTVVILADNLGRAAGGARLGEPKGVFGDIWEVKPIRPGKPTVKIGDPIDVLTFRSPLWEVQTGDATEPERLTWSIGRTKRNPMVFSVGAFGGRGILVLNGKPFAYIDRGGGEQVFIPTEALKGGANTIQFALLPSLGDGEDEIAAAYGELAGVVGMYECVSSVSAKGEWAFARWEPPKGSAFARSKGGKASGPAWWRARFGKAGGGEPLFFDATGLTKGQLYLNGRHLCRYFVARPDGKAVPPQTRYYLPAPWLNAESDNEIMVFDEHGGHPSRCRLTH